MSALILLGAFFVPFYLVAALVRGTLRRRRDRAVLRQQIKDFE